MYHADNLAGTGAPVHVVDPALEGMEEPTLIDLTTTRHACTHFFVFVFLRCRRTLLLLAGQPVCRGLGHQAAAHGLTSQ